MKIFANLGPLYIKRSACSCYTNAYFNTYSRKYLPYDMYDYECLHLTLMIIM